MNKDYIKNWENISSSIYWCMIALLVLVLIKVFINIIETSLGGWSAGELLINYAGGFVRRGILGEMFSKFPHPLLAANIAQKIVSLIFLFWIFLLIIKNNDKIKVIILIAYVLSFPGGLIDIMSNQIDGYMDRKEIWFYLAIMFSYAVFLSDGNKWARAIIISTIIISMTLVHELFFIYFSVPFILINVFGYRPGVIVLDRIYLIVLFALSLLTFMLTLVYSGTQAHVLKIINSYVNTDAENILGGIASIGWSIRDSVYLSYRMISEGSIFYWLVPIFISLYSTVYLYGKFNFKFQENHLKIIPLYFFIAMVASMFVGWDWGRWISIFNFLNLIFILHFSSGCKLLNRFGFADAFFIMLISFSIWLNLPTCCPRNFN